MVLHKCLLSKLDFYDIRGCTLQWIDDFLSDRTQQVVVDGEFSDVASVNLVPLKAQSLDQFCFCTLSTICWKVSVLNVAY